MPHSANNTGKLNVKKYQTKNQGFTLIELIVVIVILGIMSAVAVPQFINLQTDARVSVMQGIEGSIRSASTLAYSKALIDGTENAATGTITTAGGSVDIVFGYPAATDAGIGTMVDTTGATDISGSGTGPYIFTYTGRTDCQISYTAATAAAPPTIAPTTSGC